MKKLLGLVMVLGVVSVASATDNWSESYGTDAGRVSLGARWIPAGGATFRDEATRTVITNAVNEERGQCIIENSGMPNQSDPAWGKGYLTVTVGFDILIAGMDQLRIILINKNGNTADPNTSGWRPHRMWQKTIHPMNMEFSGVGHHTMTFVGNPYGVAWDDLDVMDIFLDGDLEGTEISQDEGDNYAFYVRGYNPNYDSGTGTGPSDDLIAITDVSFDFVLPMCGDPEHPIPVGDFDGDCYVDGNDVVAMAWKWLECTDPVSGCIQWEAPEEVLYIPHGEVTVDANLAEWPDSSDPNWLALDLIYTGDPNDIVSARYAVMWDGGTNDKVYAAVVVEDTDHVFDLSPTNWDTSDRIEIYAQGDPNGGIAYGDSGSEEFAIAQQYAVGPTGSGNDAWARYGNGTPIPGIGNLADAGFEYAVNVGTTTVTYEIGARMFMWYGGNNATTIEVRELEAGMQVGFDIVVDTRWGFPPHGGAGAEPDGEFGMLSANLDKSKFMDAGQFQRWELLGVGNQIATPGCGAWGYQPMDMNADCVVNLDDYAEMITHMLECTNPDPPCSYEP